MEVLHAYIYEIKKGTKPIALVTLEKCQTQAAVEKIVKNDLGCIVKEIDCDKVNIFLGPKKYLKVIDFVKDKALSKLSACEDFMLGIMLGYSIENQAERYLKFKKSFELDNSKPDKVM